MSETENSNENKKVVDLVSESIIKLLEKYLSENGISDTTIDIEAGAIPGDNYLGIIAKADVSGKNKTGEKFEESYIIKSAPKSEGFRNFAPIHLAYDREIYVYHHVLPEFKKFQKEKEIKFPFISFAECLEVSKVDKDEALIMKNLKKIGYVMKDRRNPLDYNHVKLVLTELAKFHAVSFALKDQKPEVFNKFMEDMKEHYMLEMNMELFEESTDLHCNPALETLNPETEAKEIERFKIFAKSFNDNFINSIKDQCHPYSVVRHGDSWTNNFLFKYENQKNPDEPTSLCFLDWQLSHIGPPVLDIFYFIYACTDQDLREKHYEKLLDDYYQTLKERTELMGSNLEKLYPYEVYQEQFKKFGGYAMSVAVLLLKFLLNESDEVPDMNEIFENDTSMKEAMEKFSVPSKNQHLYSSRIRSAIIHCVQKNYI